MPIDVAELDDEALAELISEATDEQARRHTLHRTPSVVVGFAMSYRAAGGDPQDLVDALTQWAKEQQS